MSRKDVMTQKPNTLTLEIAKKKKKKTFDYNEILKQITCEPLIT